MDRNRIIVYITGAILVLLVYIFTYWNTNDILMARNNVVYGDNNTARISVGRRYGGDLKKVSQVEPLEELYFNIEPFFLDEVSFEPTGYYALLDAKYEGIVLNGRSTNVIPRDMFTTKGTATRFYPGMYGQYYVVTMQDNRKVLVLVGCNENKAVETGDYKNIIATYTQIIPDISNEKFYNETAQAILDLQEEMDVSGCIWMGDTDWADRHKAGLFAMLSMKFILATIIAIVIDLLLRWVTTKTR